MSMGDIDGIPPYAPHQKLQGPIVVGCLQCRRQACLTQLTSSVYGSVVYKSGHQIDMCFKRNWVTICLGFVD
jgi:hypothetical protein